MVFRVHIYELRNIWSKKELHGSSLMLIIKLCRAHFHLEIMMLLNAWRILHSHNILHSRAPPCPCCCRISLPPSPLLLSHHSRPALLSLLPHLCPAPPLLFSHQCHQHSPSPPPSSHLLPAPPFLLSHQHSRPIPVLSLSLLTPPVLLLVLRVVFSPPPLLGACVLVLVCSGR